jgi:hypothetical protein
MRKTAASVAEGCSLQTQVEAAVSTTPRYFSVTTCRSTSSLPMK